MTLEEMLESLKDTLNTKDAEIADLKRALACTQTELDMTVTLVSDMLYTLKCGVGNYSAITEYIKRAEELGVKIP